MELGKVHAESVAQMKRLLTVLTSILTLVACANLQTNQAKDPARLSSSQAQTFVFECDDGFGFVARIEGDNAWVFLPGETLALPHVDTVSGSAYAADNTSLMLRGDQASLISDHAEHTGYSNNHARAIWEHAKLEGVDFRALGNEPGWILEISNNTELKLVTDYGQRSYRFKAAWIEPDQRGRTTTYTASTAEHNITVTITGNACR